MRSRSVTALAALLAGLLSAEAAAQNSKAGVATSGAILLEAAPRTYSWDPVLATHIRVPQQEDLVFDVALQCGLYTDTTVKSSGGKKDTSSSQASVAVRVAVQRWLGVDAHGNDILGEPVYALPNGREGVVYCARKQTLSATLQGIIENLLCFPDDGTGVQVFDPDAPGCELTDEELQLVLETLNANAFNFTAMDLTSGDYRVTVEAEITTDTDSENGSANARGMVGLGSLVVDEVRFVKDEDAGSGM
jgi:hypothetical protein